MLSVSQQLVIDGEWSEVGQRQGVIGVIEVVRLRHRDEAMLCL